MRDVVIHLGVDPADPYLAVALLVAGDFEVETDEDSWRAWGEPATPDEPLHLRVPLRVQEGLEGVVTEIVGEALGLVLVPADDGTVAVMTEADDYSVVIHKTQGGVTP